MKETILKTGRSKTEVIRDNHDESGKYYFHQTVYDDDILHRNKRIRLESLAPEGKKMPLLDKETGGAAPVQFAFSIAPEHFSRLRRDYPDIYQGLVDSDPEENIKAARRLQILFPEWSLMEANR